MGGKKKKKKKKETKSQIRAKKYPGSKADERGKEAMKIEPPDKNEFKMDNENSIDKFLRFRPRVKKKFDTLKEKSRKKL